jgi:DME family drug/metabolite transporter
MEKGYPLVILSAVFYGCITVGCKFFTELGLSLYEISLFTLFCGTMLLLPVVFLRRMYMVKRDMLAFFIVYGLIGSLLQLTSFGAVVLGVPIAVVVLLLYTEPIWTVLFAKPLLGEKITRRKVVAIIVTLVGVFVVIKPWDAAEVGGFYGVISALLAGILLSLWVIYGRESDIHKQHYITTTFGSMGFALPWLLLFYPFISFFIVEESLVRFSLDFPAEYWLYLSIFVFIAYIIPDSLFYKGLNYVSASRAGIILPLEPISATILATVLFQQPVTVNILLGGALILASNYIMVRR